MIRLISLSLGSAAVLSLFLLLNSCATRQEEAKSLSLPTGITASPDEIADCAVHGCTVWTPAELGALIEYTRQRMERERHSI